MARPDDDGSEDREPHEPAPGEPAQDADELPSVGELIGTFLGEPSLWPVLVVVLGAFGAFGAALLVLTGVDRNPFAAAALLLLAGMTVDVLMRSRRDPRFRSGAKLVLLLWLAAVLLAGVAIWSGVAYG